MCEEGKEPQMVGDNLYDRIAVIQTLVHVINEDNCLWLTEATTRRMLMPGLNSSLDINLGLGMIKNVRR